VPTPLEGYDAGASQGTERRYEALKPISPQSKVLEVSSGVAFIN
jgi:hypothetical protein